MKFTKYVFLVIGLLSLAILISGCSNNDGSDTISGEATGVFSNDAVLDSSGSSEVVEIPIDSITEQAQFFEQNVAGFTITYFAVKGSDGEIRTAFDACDVCGGYKGYHQEGNQMVCNNCGQKFAIDSLGSKNSGSGCWPSNLGRTIEGDNLVIEVSELEQNKFRFA